MAELMRNFTMLLWLTCAVNQGTSSAHAQGITEENANINSSMPTLIVGKAAEPDSGYNEVIVEQPAGGGNPLGDPLPDIISSEQDGVPSEADSIKIPRKPVQAHSEDQKDLGKDFQNTLMEANGMVYDVQAYPKADLRAIGNSANPKTIYSPNVNP